MPNKPIGNKKSNSKNPADWQKFEFARVTLDDKAKAAFKKAYAENAAEMLGELGSYAVAGYKFSLAWDDNGQCFIASMTCREPSDPNFNYVLSSRSSDAFEALALNIYKTRNYCADGVWTDGTEESNWG